MSDSRDWLHSRGNVALLDKPAVAVIGTQKPTPYGPRATRAVATRVLQQDMVVLAGLAYGIDQTAHQTALDLEGPTIAVLPHGIDRPPWINGPLAQDILDQDGLLVSEHGGSSGLYKGCYHDYCKRQAELSAAVIVVECPMGDGTFWTVQAAREKGIPVAALQYPADMAQPTGNQRLIAEGARPLAGREDIMQFLDEARQRSHPNLTSHGHDEPGL